MKRSRDLGYALSLVPGLLVISANIAGGNWVWVNIGVSVALWFVDWLCWESREASPRRSPAIPNAVLVLSVMIHTLAVASLLYGVHVHILRSRFLLPAIISTGINSGMEGILVAHELIHRSRWAWRWAGVWNLLLVNYGHFYIAHIQIHHRFVGTHRDPSTGRRGESIYWFLPRAIVQNLVQSLHFEAARLRRLHRAPFGWSNFVVRVILLQFALAGVTFALGPEVLRAYLWQSLVAVILIEIINYIEHYGLTRDPGAKITPALSWHTDTVCDRFLLLELNRHADHHMRASRPYHELVSYPESPNLPAGYWGMLILMLLPPLWYFVMHRRLDRLKEENACNVGPLPVARAA
jgi:alkane 1-monooxygenase